MYVDFIEKVHTSTKRDYRERAIEHDKIECALVANQFGMDYFDGDRKYGYGGYRYDGRWRSVADAMVQHYGIKPGDRILDVGCGKGFLLYDFTQVLPGVEIAGIDISDYAIGHAKEEVRPFLQVGNAVDLPFADQSFDLVVSFNTLHNLRNFDLRSALEQMQRVGRAHKYLVVDTFRNEAEKVNLLYWQLTCRCFYTPPEWEWIFEQSGYTGDHGFIWYE